MAMTTSFIVLIFSFYCVSALSKSERAAIIQSTIAEVKEENNRLTAQSAGQPLSSSLRKLRAFKQATPQMQAHGNARLLFERMVKIAERKIIEEERKAVGQDAKELTNSYARELVNKPGDILTAQEIYDVFQSSGCANHFNVTARYNCNTAKDKVWRRANGTCNNQAYPLYGAANTPMKRIITADYEDRISEPRGFFQLVLDPSDASARPNPSPRVVRTNIITDVDENDPVHSLMLMQFGQFMDHDLDFMPEYAESTCTSCDFTVNPGACFPIKIPDDDREGEECFHFSRSLPVCGDEDNPEAEPYDMTPRNHVNMITHYIDASTVYGSGSDLQNRLRGDNGLLRTEEEMINGRKEFSMPIDNNVTREAPIPECKVANPDKCRMYLAGDGRANENPGLITMHTLWVREHNRIAKALHEKNLMKEEDDRCDDDAIFHTARNIVTSEIEHIFYDDYLREILGRQFWEDMNLNKYTGYKKCLKPNIPNAFASAAFRYGHSQVQPHFEAWRKNGPVENVDLFESFFNTAIYREYGTDPFLRGLMNQNARQLDEFITDILTDRLFGNSHDHGLDLASLNLNRGRDHGIPPYVIWRNWAQQKCMDPVQRVCHDPTSNVIDIPRFRNDATEVALLKIYGSLDSVDLFLGGLAERPLRGGLVGPTIGCILAHTFISLRDGDRFFYENRDIFTNRQINSIKRVSLANVICENTNNFGLVKRNPFVVNSPGISCDTLRFPEPQSLNLDVWDCSDFDPNRMEEGAQGQKSEEQSILSTLKEIVEKLEAQEAHMTSNAEENDKTTVMTDAQLAEKLEALIKKAKK